jgi:ribosomal protein S18 acetylase RimI-like enzyme
VLRGLGWVYQPGAADGATKHRAIVYPIADPGHESLEDVLISWCDEVATALLAGADDGRSRILRGWSPLEVKNRIARFEAHGYQVARYFQTLSRPVAGAPSPQPPQGVVLADWEVDAHEGPTWEVHVEAFADHWGSVPPDRDNWAANYLRDTHTRLDLSCVAVANGEVVGYSLNQVWPEDVEVRGITEGYIAVLGVRRAWRRKGVATALILESIRRFAGAEFDNATLTVDADSVTGAFDLYRGLGFEAVSTDVALVKTLGT